LNTAPQNDIDASMISADINRSAPNALNAARHEFQKVQVGSLNPGLPFFFADGDVVSDQKPDLDQGSQNDSTNSEDVAPVSNRRENDQSGAKGSTRARKDKDCVHRTRHGILSRYPLQILIDQGESKRRLLQIEKNFISDLAPTGTIGNAIFDRMFSSYLRVMLAGKMESRTMIVVDSPARPDGMQVAGISAQELPTLIFSADPRGDLQNLSPESWSQIALVQKYDSYYSREFFRCLGLLLVLKHGGELALAGNVSKVLGTHKDPVEG
jgi:hypothetical protein